MTAAAPITDWIGRERRDEDEITVTAVRRLAATLDRDPTRFGHGSELPESWYAILFAPLARHGELGADGHPAADDFLPQPAGVRRVFGGRRTRFLRPLRIGEAVERHSQVTAVAARNGRSGPLTVVTVAHAISGPSGLAVTEEQDIVYRPAAKSAGTAPAGTAPAATAAAPPPAPGADAEAEWSRSFDIDPALAFRYSALTFNAHRIHYDLEWARGAEFYPGLLVNGGLTVLLLIETARPHLPRAVAGYAARAVRPLFVGAAATLRGRLRDGGADLWASGPDGGAAYRVGVTFGDENP